MSTKIKFDRHSIKFRLWVYFIGIGIGLLLLVWFLQIFFLNNYYEHMKQPRSPVSLPRFPTPMRVRMRV